jgi:uncharacterized protein (DUF427 family)
MAVMMRELLASQLDNLRYEPTAKRLRVAVGKHPVADTYNGLLVWEPRRVVPTYAVPVQDFSAQIEVTAGQQPPQQSILDPTIPFSAHTVAGEAYDVVVGESRLPSVAFRPVDPDLANYVLLDFTAFDWREEEESIVSHPRDPYKRIDTLRSSRHVRLELDGALLAESRRSVMLFETLLPVRFYLPRDDVVAQLEPSDTATYCAYKGRASYFSLPGVRDDIAWTYREPLHDAVDVRDYICFFDERVDVIVDRRRRDRPRTPWSD